MLKLGPMPRLHAMSRFLLYFFLPVACAFVLGATFNFVSMSGFRDLQIADNVEQAADLQAALKTSQLGFEMLQLQQELSDLLVRARAKQVDEGAAYKVHSAMVDRLAVLDARIHTLFAGPGKKEFALALEQFSSYRNYVIRATDIVAIDPSVAASYIAQANDQYYAFTELMQQIGVDRTADSLAHLESTQSALSTKTRQTQMFGIGVTVVGTIVWFFVAWLLSVRLSLLARVMHRLKQDDDKGDSEQDFAEIANLAQKPLGLIGSIAAAVVAFRQSNAERTAARAALQAERNTLEEQVELRTSKLVEAGHALIEQQQSLQEAHDEQRAIFDTVTVGIVLMQDRMITRCNQRAEAIFGYETGEMLGLPTRVWYADEAGYAMGGQSVSDDVRSGAIHQREQELVRKDGSRFWARMTGRLFDQANEHRGLLGIVEDISLEREAAEALRRSKDLAEGASRAKSNFLANMSHEIRTPMNAIMGMSYMVLKTDLSQRQREYVKKIQISSQHLLGIINDILDYSKIEAGKLNIEKIEFELDKVLDTVASLVSEKSFSKGLELVFDIDKAVPNYLVGDPLRLGQILLNYANNAVKFTASGEIHIQVRLLEESDTGVLLYGAVKDTGIGLTQDQIGQLFQSFQQADASTTRQFGGTGLGLAISKQLADLMDGEVGVISVFGEGSTFWFTARLGKGVAQPRTLALSGDLNGKRVLVVDDNESARMLLTDMLSTLNLQVDQADSARAAMEVIDRAQAQNQPYEMLFLDWQMPVMNGTELAKKVRERALQTVPHMVLVTGYGREEVLKGAEESGIEDVLIKPVNASMLFDCVVRALGGAPPKFRQPVDAPSATEESLAQIRGARILLVEDNDLNQDVATELLRGVGFVVDVADNGQVAVDRVQMAPYDVVLMDMQMPVMDGLTATRVIRQLTGMASLPIVAMTANAMHSDRQACLDAGMNDHVAKPIEPDELFKTLLKWVVPRTTLVSPLPVPSGAALEVDLPTIEGLDTFTGLRRLRGNKPMYLALLHKFAAGQGDAVTHIRAALDADDWPTAERLAHTTKGVAANISLVPVQQAALALEAAIKARQSRHQIEPLLDACEQALQRFVSDLLVLAPLPVAAPLLGAVDAAQVASVCQQLAAWLAEDNMQASDLLVEHDQLLRAAWGVVYPDIEAAIRNFDYEVALVHLKAFAGSHGVSL
jgi:two-component system sensor histidine kinase/response regulator